ncbi:MAG: cytochrome b/b6 domain-containing protein [Desulfobacteraceae bacterium]
MDRPASDASKSAVDPSRPILIWDLPTRIFHWMLVVAVAASFATGKLGGTWMAYHKLSGYIIFSLLLFRLIWGIFGGHHAQFINFVRGPGAVLGYARSMLRRDMPGHLGHNPLGGWSVLAMLITLMIQVVTGLFANDDIFTEGPLYDWVSKATSDWLTKIHKLNQEVILALVAIHVMAILFYLVIKGDNLIQPMITGYKHWRGEAPATSNSVWTAALIAGLSAVSVYFLVR